jgi:hypothetical protein
MKLTKTHKKNIVEEAHEFIISVLGNDVSFETSFDGDTIDDVEIFSEMTPEQESKIKEYFNDLS